MFLTGQVYISILSKINIIADGVRWKNMVRYVDNKNIDEYPSLYDAFELGDRVKRIHKDKKGRDRTYKGIVLSIDNEGIEVYWDTKDGKYRPNDMRIAFSHCQIEEIFKGTKDYSPIEKE